MADRFPKKLNLKDGKTATLRPLEQSDEQALVQFFATLPPESTEFLKDDVRDAAVVQRFVKEADPERVWALLAFNEEGKIIGDATLHTDRRGWRRHIGEVRVVVAPEVQKSGLATALIHALVNQASIKGLRKLEAQILDSQIGALKAFERLGFREEARLAGHAVDLQEQEHDLLILTNTVEDLWQKMEELISGLEFARDSY